MTSEVLLNLGGSAGILPAVVGILPAASDKSRIQPVRQYAEQSGQNARAPL